MKTNCILVIAAILSMCIICSSCLPLVDEAIEASGLRQSLVRQKRVTCDLLSFEAKGVKLNHAACAAHCLALGKRGGYCSSAAVCVCRN